MTRFTQQQIEQIERVLNDRYRSLLEEVRDELEGAGEQHYVDLLAGGPPDVGDESVADALADLNAAVVDRQMHEIRAIEAAHDRLKAGTFGECSDCGGDIEFERLRVYPSARRCVRCQDKYEKTYAGESRPSM
ncbi:MAG: TraR/DksA family transcriptional regulator [Betaproteobacteria bacterium]|nr:TraR/DksA family transcriptional regulator [Betaproteobacteria bacterium]